MDGQMLLEADGPTTPSDEDPGVDEAAVAAFGRWYEEQPPEWVELLDELGRGDAARQRRRSKHADSISSI